MTVATTTTVSAAQGIVAADWIATSSLAHYALTWGAYPGSDRRYVWEVISSSPAEAAAFYASITDRDELRELAADALALCGWDRRKIGFKLS